MAKQKSGAARRRELGLVVPRRSIKIARRRRRLAAIVADMGTMTAREAAKKYIHCDLMELTEALKQAFGLTDWEVFDVIYDKTETP